MMKGVPPVDAHTPPKVRASIDLPHGVNPYYNYASAGYPWMNGMQAPYVPYGRRGSKRMSMAALPYPAGAVQLDESAISSEQEAAEKNASKPVSQVSQPAKKKQMHRPSTAMASGAYPYRYGN